MANWHQEESDNWITDLESLLYEDKDKNEPGYWTGARWLTEGDILFFYQTDSRPKRFIRKLLKEARELPATDAEPVIRLLERNRELVDRYAGTIFACARVTGPSEYLSRANDVEDTSHFRSRIFVPFHKAHVFDAPLGGEQLKQHVKVNTGGSVTPLLGEDFERVKQELARRNDLPEYLVNARPGGRGFRNISRETWRDISCASSQRFIDESQIRVYLLDYLLDELKDHGTPLLQECDCSRAGRRTGRADYFIQVGTIWVAVEAKLNILCERDLLGQLAKYTNIQSFQPQRGQYRGRQFTVTSSTLCLVADQAGLYLVDDDNYVLGAPGSPAWPREELSRSVAINIRETLLSRLALRSK